MIGPRVVVTILLAVAFAVATAAGATDYYVSSSLGDDAWSGTLSEPNAGFSDGPKQSLVAAEDLLNATAQPGDRVLLRRGDTWTSSEGLTVNTANGEEASPIVMGAYGTGDKPILDISGTGNAVTVRGSYNDDASAWLRFENLTITTTASPGNRPVGIYVSETYRPYVPHHITFSSCNIEGFKHGITLFQEYRTIESCVIKDNYGILPETGYTQGLYAQGNYITIRNNLFENNGRPDSYYDHNIYVSHGSGYVIEGNTIRNALDGIKVRGADNTVVRDNVIYAMNLGAISVGGDNEVGIENVIIERNLIYDTVNGITVTSQSGTQTEPSANITIRNNILHSNRPPTPIAAPTSGYLTVLDPLDGVFVYNNAIFGISGDYERNLLAFCTDPSNLQIKNNIFARTDLTRPALEIYYLSAMDGLYLDNNLYHYPGGVVIRVDGVSYWDLSSFRAAYPAQEAAGVEGDPAFADPPADLHLTALSVNAIDLGADATNLVDSDFDGAQRPWDGDQSGTAEWDIGPYEYLSPNPIFADDFESGGVTNWSLTAG